MVESNPYAPSQPADELDTPLNRVQLFARAVAILGLVLSVTMTLVVLAVVLKGALMIYWTLSGKYAPPFEPPLMVCLVVGSYAVLKGFQSSIACWNFQWKQACLRALVAGISAALAIYVLSGEIMHG